MSAPGGGLRARLPELVTSASPPEVVLPWLVRLRWVAVAGQTSTVVLVAAGLPLALPYWALAALIAVTAATNALLALWVRRGAATSAALVPAVLVLDTLLFTALVALSGGPANPFHVLYVVHVAMAAVTLSVPWTLAITALSAACCAVLFSWHVPLLQHAAGGAGPLDPALLRLGSWFAVTLVAGVTAYFMAGVTQALRRREAQVTQLRGVAARNERLASLTTLAAGAAHELGTPLGTIAVVARELELAAGRRPDGEALAEDARLVRSQVDRCRAILDRMSAQASQGGARPERLALPQLLEDLRAELGDGARVRLEHDPALAGVVAPRQDLVQALAPLIKNALDASPEGAPVALEVARAAGLLRFSVRDQGAGMDADALARAGEPFFTTKPPGHGTGLGLYTVRLLAERLGGSLRLSSDAGTGTTATLEFPELEAEGGPDA